MVAEVGTGISQLSCFIEVIAHLLKVPLNHVDIGLVVLVLDTRVSDDANSKFVEAHCDFFALFFPVWVVLAFEKGLHVDDRGLCEGEIFVCEA